MTLEARVRERLADRASVGCMLPRRRHGVPRSEPPFVDPAASDEAAVGDGEPVYRRPE